MTNDIDTDTNTDNVKKIFIDTILQELIETFTINSYNDS